ncbi:hypothetical protein GCM10017783_25930 [Deinococcus piscis]|uniref:Uncharacterized protein n=1 Tax=Deinococcus piscis TaxID=394230 RepID=A0ABQ3KIN7_9DEIO|nr:hypothetical protein [Deinococcus piscis]GHG12750.1 hypothetical protein GCM10017783_25930 [Deinococcus piscis]
MEYHLYIYSARVKHFIQHHGGWESHPDAAFALPKKFAAAIRGRLLSYGFAEKDSGKFEKMYGSVPVTVRTFAGSVIFSLPYPTQFEAQLSR